jgi:hypothetical protein
VAKSVLCWTHSKLHPRITGGNHWTIRPSQCILEF